MKHWLHKLRRRLAGTPAALERYLLAPPSPQNALDIFPGEWSSQFPASHPGLRAGRCPTFEDPRIAWGLAALGGVQGRRVLELGPMEGAHTAMLEWAGAEEILAIEANTRAFLRCLVVKEILGLRRARFLCGDFMQYLPTAPRWDLVLASGVLYHQPRPAELLALLGRASDRVLLWTHYYDHDLLAARPEFARRFPRHETAEQAGFVHTLHRQAYNETLSEPTYCGGARAYSSWLSRADILKGLEFFGFRRLTVGCEEPRHRNGPAFAVAASR